MVRTGSAGDGDGVEPVEGAVSEGAEGGAAAEVDGAAAGKAGGSRLTSGPLGAVLSGERKVSRLEKRREKIRAEIERNRRGEYKVPTWVLAVALVVFVAGWVALIVFA